MVKLRTLLYQKVSSRSAVSAVKNDVAMEVLLLLGDAASWLLEVGCCGCGCCCC